jgi:hyperosmotically inducible protein
MWLRSLVVSRVVIVLIASSVPCAASAQVSDTALAERVTQAVQRYGNFGIFDDVNVEISNRAVTLTGRVTTAAKREAIGDHVAKIDGLRGVTNDIQVLPNSPLDTRLRATAAQAIYGHSAFWRYASMANPPIHIIVANGRITLTGCVTSEVEDASLRPSRRSRARS